MQAVNLLPEYARPGHRWASTGSELSSRRILPIGGTAAVALALIFGLFYFHERSVVSSKKSELATAQARLVAQSARAEPIKQAQAASQARLAFMQAVTANRVHWDSVLGDLGRVLPAGVSQQPGSISARWCSRRDAVGGNGHDRGQYEFSRSRRADPRSPRPASMALEHRPAVDVTER